MEIKTIEIPAWLYEDLERESEKSQQPKEKIVHESIERKLKEGDTLRQKLEIEAEVMRIRNEFSNRVFVAPSEEKNS